MEDDAAAAGVASPSPSPSSSGASPSPRSKRCRTDRYALGFEFAPRLAPPAPVPAPASRSLPEWTEESTFALLNAWGESFVRSGRRSLSADEWLEVRRLAAAAASRPAGYFTESQCRNRIDNLRKMFRKERSRLAANHSSQPPPSKWVYFDKMMSLVCPPPPSPPPLLSPLVTRRRDTQPVPRLSWGGDVSELVLAGCDNAPGDAGSGAELGEEETHGTGAVEGNELGLLTESIRKFGEVYERMEISKRQHMAEVKRMRRDFQRDLEVRWREILEKAQAEIMSLEEEDDTEGDDNKRLGDANGGEEQNNDAVDASP